MNASRLFIGFVITLSAGNIVQGQAKVATGTVTIVGTDSIVPPTNTYDFGFVSVSISSAGTAGTPYGNSGTSPSSPSDVAAGLCTAINSTPNISSLVKCAGSSGPTVNLAAQFAGAAGNGIRLAVSARSSFPGASSSAFSNSTTTGALTGGGSQTQTRGFQMALWVDPSGPPVDADIAFFSEGATQPGWPTRSVLLSTDFTASDPAATWNSNVTSYDFRRILAVVVDEPYWDNISHTDWSNPCRDSRNSSVQALYQKLQALATAIRQTPNASRVRFWINFSEPEMQWMIDDGCPLFGSFADVVSLDKYRKPFTGPCTIVLQQEAPCVQPYYDWLVGHRAFAGQQMALVPGTFVRVQNGMPLDDGTQQANLLSGFFNYADGMNQTCNLPRGNLGATGSFDRCPMWTVVGFPGQSFTDSSQSPPVLWLSELDTDPVMQPIQQAWRNELKLAIRQPLAASIIELVHRISN